MSEEYRRYWSEAHPWERYLREEVREHRQLWEGVHRTHETPEWAVRRAREAGGGWRLLVLAADWCGDASSTVPVLAALADAAPDVDLRVLERDENPDLMDRYLTDGSRSIPIAIVLDEDFEPVGHWGPRPVPLQRFVIGEKRRGEMETAEIYRETRRWYARDRGETTLRELLEILEGAARPAGTAG